MAALWATIFLSEHRENEAITTWLLTQKCTAPHMFILRIAALSAYDPAPRKRSRWSQTIRIVVLVHVEPRHTNTAI